MTSRRNHYLQISLFGLILILLSLLFIMPFYLIVINSFKTFRDIMLDTAAFPKTIYWGNYTEAWKVLNYPRSFLNSFVITVLSNIGVLIISSMAAYRLVRYPTRFNRFIFIMFLSAMIIPFQSIMIPLVKVASTLDLTNSIPGLIICYYGFGVSFPVFLFHGFIKNVPREIEESAIIDGCGQFRLFWLIVFPLIKSASVTVLILNTLWFWNDYLLPLLILQKKDLRTIPLAASFFFSKYNKQWDLGLAGLVMSIIPIIIFFIVMQKHIIKGITTGSVKG